MSLQISSLWSDSVSQFYSKTLVAMAFCTAKYDMKMSTPLKDKAEVFASLNVWTKIENLRHKFWNRDWNRDF